VLDRTDLWQVTSLNRNRFARRFEWTHDELLDDSYGNRDVELLAVA
jgi:hypothetical protein